MSEASLPQLPAWVYKRDGRLVPFDADRISQALFAAGEALGKPDAFLARELTDGILHFLARDHGGAIPTTAQIAELAATVVRELGQAALSQAFAEGNQQRVRRAGPAVPGHPAGGEPGETRVTFAFSLADSPEAVRRGCLREYGLRAIFGRDLAAAHHDGLLTLCGLEAAQQLAGCVFDPARRRPLAATRTDSAHPSGRSGVLVQALLQARRLAGGFLAIDGPEYALSPFASARDLAKNSGELLAGLEAADLLAIINLNAAQPPPWAEEQPEGPLFAEPRRSPTAHLHEYRSVLLEQLLRPPVSSRVRFDWHLADSDFTGEPASTRLARLARLAMDSLALSFVFDRPERPPALAEGLDRRCPGVLQVVGVHLPRLLDMPGARGAPAAFLQKIASLARMAVSAGAQKREYLRRHDRGQEHLAREFLLDRARLVVVPVGLDATVRGLVGQGIAAGPRGLEMGQQILASLLANLRQAGLAANLEVGLDGLCLPRFGASPGFALDGETAAWPRLERVAGLTPWDPTAAPRDQLRAAGALHAVAGAGTAAVLLPPQTSGIDEVLDLLTFAHKHTDVVRVRFLRVPDRQAQLAW